MERGPVSVSGPVPSGPVVSGPVPSGPVVKIIVVLLSVFWILFLCVCPFVVFSISY